MSEEKKKAAGLDDPTLAAHAEVETWDDSTRLDPPGTAPGADPTGQEIADALGRALLSYVPGRDLAEDETVLPRGGIPVPPARPKIPPSAPTLASRPPQRPPEPKLPDGGALPLAKPVQVPDAPTEAVSLGWDEPSTATAGAVSPLKGDAGAPSGPFGVDSTELDLNLWAVQDGLEAAIVSTGPSGAPPPNLRPGANKGLALDADWGDQTVRLDETPEALRNVPDTGDLPPWETEPKPWEQPAVAEQPDKLVAEKPAPKIDLRPQPFSVRLPPPLNAPPDSAFGGKPADPFRPADPARARESGAPFGTPRGLVETDNAALRDPAGSIVGAPRVVMGRPASDPASREPRRSLSRVMPAGPQSLLDDESGEPLGSDFSNEVSTNTFARFGRLSVSRAKKWLTPKRSEHNPLGRPGGVGVPVGAERRRYRRIIGIAAIIGVLVIGALLGFLLTVTLAKP